MISFIPPLDAEGSAFLASYAVAFLFALAWSVRRRFRANETFSRADAGNVTLSDPYEIAYLAGGAPRCSQVAVVRLIQSGAVEWHRTRFLRESRLVATCSAEPGFNDIERTLHSSIKGYGKKGMPLIGIPQLVATRLSGVESKLAKLGLRPTAAESRGRSLSVSLPLILLMLAGTAKLVIGFLSDKPFGFLMLFLIITLIALIIVASTAGRLTAAGKELLGRMRSDVGSVPSAAEGTLCAVALLGISAVAWVPSLAGLDAAMRKEISQMGNSRSSPDASAGSSSSGCSSSGCSSGCGGGCGGCGGD